MKTLIITKKELDKDNYYCGKENLSDYFNPFNGHVEIAEGLGYVGFKSHLSVVGSIVAKAGSGIKAGEGIKAGSGIKAGEGIEAGSGIEAGWGIKAGWGIVSLYSWIKAALKIEVDARCRIAAGIFSHSGPQDVEAQEIIGEIAYGNKKLLPKEEMSEEKTDLLAKADELIAKANELKAEAEKL